MFAKLALVILTIGVVAATLLAARQQRLYAVHESAVAIRRIAEHDRTLWRLRSEIAERITPGKVRMFAQRFGPLAYYYGERTSSIVQAPVEGVGSVRPASEERTRPAPAPGADESIQASVDEADEEEGR